MRAWLVITSTVATFLVVLTLLAYQLRTGHDPALGARPGTALLAPGSHGSRLISRTSGAAAAQPVNGAAPGAPALSSHTSGAAARDD